MFVLYCMFKYNFELIFPVNVRCKLGQEKKRHQEVSFL